MVSCPTCSKNLRRYLLCLPLVKIKKNQFTCVVALGKCDASCKVDNSGQRCQNGMRQSSCGQKEQKLGIVLQSVLMSPLKKNDFNQLTEIHTKLCCFLLFLNVSKSQMQISKFSFELKNERFFLYFCPRERPLMTSDIRVGRGVQDIPLNRTL